ncbi:hypothetical protein AB0Y31_10920, partial [Lactobacillus crispatus]|uniref:hypothetical protein n=1 Tax=Lactobacillus crispatus TaxID=47770 RepID=UPI003F28D16C
NQIYSRCSGGTNQDKSDCPGLLFIQSGNEVKQDQNTIFSQNKRRKKRIPKITQCYMWLLLMNARQNDTTEEDTAERRSYVVFALSTQNQPQRSHLLLSKLLSAFCVQRLL